MTPRKLIEWTLAILAVLGSFAVGFAAIKDFYTGRYARFGAIPGVLRPLLLIAAAAVLPTFLVFILQSKRGRLEFKALGISFTGPSGPILLWVVTFMAVIVALVATMRAFHGQV